MTIISIVIPTYNSSKFIDKSLSEIFNQLNKINVKSEIILVNDFSLDNTYIKLIEIKKKLIKKKINLILINNNHNIGQFKSTIGGIKKAKGKYIITIDDDITFENDIIVRLFKKFYKSNNLEVLFAHYNKGNFLDKVARFIISNTDNNTSKQTGSNRIFGLNSKKKILKVYKRYNNFNLLFTENFKKISTINLLIKNIVNIRVSNYSLFQKFKIFFLTRENLFLKFATIFSYTASFFIISSISYIIFLLYKYFILKEILLGGWLSLILLSLSNILLCSLILILIVIYILKNKS